MEYRAITVPLRRIVGTGYVYDVIADFDGKPSITLTEFADNAVTKKTLHNYASY